jgi:hypothetical protein
MKNITFFLLFLFSLQGLAPKSVLAQDTLAVPEQRIGLSFHTGTFSTGLSDYATGVVVGGGLALPLTSSRNGLSLIGKATYFSKSGTPSVTSITFSNGQITSQTMPANGTASLKQWLFNGGLACTFPIAMIKVSIRSGLVFTSIKEHKEVYDSTFAKYLISDSKGGGLLGVFAGVGIEKSIWTDSLLVFAEADWNISFTNILVAIGNYGGRNLNIGIRYYLPSL